jgi:methionine synthase I (cobalamin-dependent)
MKITIQDLIASREVVLTDGAMGTSLFSLGLERGKNLELWNIERPELVQGIHRDFIRAGAQIILTNSFGGNRILLTLHGLEARVDELNRVAAQLARTEADSADKPVVVAGSIGPTGSLLAPLGALTFDQALGTFEEQARALIDGGVDVLWIETMADLEEVRAAVEGCRNVVQDFPIVATMTFDTHGHTSMGVSPQDAIKRLAELNLVAIGGNCGNGPKEIETVIEKMHADSPEVILVAKSNAGAPRLEGDQPVYDATPEDMADHALRVRSLGASIIGACCGSTPDHIQAMNSALGGDTVAP